jgi:hypothetical protein
LPVALLGMIVRQELLVSFVIFRELDIISVLRFTIFSFWFVSVYHSNHYLKTVFALPYSFALLKIRIEVIALNFFPKSFQR